MIMRKIKQYLIGILSICSLAMLLSAAGCAGNEGFGNQGSSAGTALKNETGETKEIFAMDTYMTLTAYGDGAKAAIDQAEQEIKRLDQLLSTGIDSSEVSQINQLGQADVSKDTEYLINRSKQLYEDTEGVFDITIYPLMKAWGFTDQKYRVPKEEELHSLLSLLGPDEIQLESGHVTTGKEGMEIDLGGIAKGYTSGRVMEIFRENGIEHAVISLGGNVHTLGSKPDGSLWRIAIEDPSDSSKIIGIIQVKDKAVITSGGYERYFEEKGETYHHILDPSTGYPAKSGLTSVTIVSEDGTLADGLSTALFIMGKEKAVDYWRKHKESFDMVLVEEDGQITATKGLTDSFSSKQEWETVE